MMFAKNLLIYLSCSLLAITSADPIEQKKKSVVGINLYSKWPQTPLYLEASEFLAEENESYFWKFIDLFNHKLSTLNSTKDHKLLPKDQYDLTVELSEAIIPVALQPLLKFSLSLRSYSPTIEMFNQIATNYLLTRSFDDVCDVFVEISHLKDDEDNSLICSLENIKAKINALLDRDSDTELVHPNIYKIDHVYSKSNLNSISVILYGDFTSQQFQSIFDYLKQLTRKDKISLYVRHFVKKTSKETEKVSLSGYGVELQIKSTEYKAQDDTKGNFN